jgi:hypothetical protein
MKLVMLNSDMFKQSLSKLTASKLPVKTTFKLKGIILKMQEELKKYEETRMELLNTYCQKNDQGQLAVDDKGQAIFLSEESQLEFGQKIVELGNLDIEIGKISISEIENVELELSDMFALDGLVVE